jgi:hypothetical protein
MYMLGSVPARFFGRTTRIEIKMIGRSLGVCRDHTLHENLQTILNMMVHKSKDATDTH